MVAIKILRAKEEEEENVNSVARGHNSSNSAVFPPKIPSWFAVSDVRRIYTHEVSLKLPKSRLSETAFFILKKASRLGEMCWSQHLA